MIIETKFDKGENAVVISNNKIITRTITQIAYRCKTVYYTMIETKGVSFADKDTEIEREESECFKTIEELAEHYKRKQ